MAVALLNGSIQIWYLNDENLDPKCLLELESNNKSGILSIAWSSNGLKLVTASRDGFVRVFEPLKKDENKCIIVSFFYNSLNIL